MYLNYFLNEIFISSIYINEFVGLKTKTEKVLNSKYVKNEIV
jgi:hypothetical protein